MITSDKPLRDRRAEFPQWRDSDYDASFESNLVLHAMRELSGMGYPGSDKMNRQMAYDIMDLVIRFSQQGHSGMSASYSLQTLQRLLNFENLNPLTTDPADWIGVGDMIWQNRRRGEAFSNDAGKTYYLLSEERKWVKKVVPLWVAMRLTNRVWNRMKFPLRHSIRR